ncbi:nitrogenase iron-molybdenum cofactor biosynthesis protein NifN [Aestuariirhabdus litorea]|uniref:Nitrogenase iron-molybdenum cofactor biosynthesis protein NifN n=1 Tax=Aestuariirhabdus litorea TaxID=2528527 RepID=A0A3P3VQ35_9GAMM|nr:nitrogenase iron-molybdenum cofactor biosynthesis protein NifN [Aestuariirhabdus litorea]RRJ82923.1 nitrogenase iron-molybdenum cofactor biosynthesis protein NifN [Aestuariirhabdus litorea]RWW93082.1 nitrogenase iron-molybdenum cofactor biosynthesis protein NifN [Endozoicomonadaceae bacterium GTF-13]
MPQIEPRKRPLAVNPIKSSQPLGATLACLGIRQAIPLLHSSQGCSAFAKVFLVQHFREPIPLQTTAMDQVSTVMGGDENLAEALLTLCSKSCPALILVATTGLTEAQGSDIERVIRQFRQHHPEHQATRIVPLNSPDFKGCLESGFALALEAMIQHLVPANGPGRVASQPRQVNLLVGANHTPADIEQIKEWIAAFGLTPLVLPDISDSLGHLVEQDFSPLTLGGTPVSAFDQLGASAATLVVGRSLARAAKRLEERTAVPSYRFDHLMGLEACDRFIHCLQTLSGQPVPDTIERQRAQLQDAMVDTHFQLGLAPVAIAGDPDLLLAFGDWLSQMGATLVAAVTPVAQRALERLPCTRIQQGDLADLVEMAQEQGAELLIGNSHLASAADQLRLPLIRAGFPQHDIYGAHRRCWVGYGGSAQTLFEIATARLHADPHRISVYHSPLSQKRDNAEPHACTGGCP